MQGVEDRSTQSRATSTTFTVPGPGTLAVSNMDISTPEDYNTTEDQKQNTNKSLEHLRNMVAQFESRLTEQLSNIPSDFMARLVAYHQAQVRTSHSFPPKL